VGLGLFKFQVVIPIAVLFLLWRCWRFVLGFTAALVILASVSAWMVGSDQTGIYVRSLFSMAAAAVPASNLLRYPVPLQTMANFHGFAFGVLGGKLPQVWVQVVTFLLSGAVILWTALRGRRISNPPQLLLLALPCSVLVSYYAFIHDLSVLLLPMLVLLNFFLPYEGQEGKKKERWISRSAALMFVAPVAESFFPEHFYLVAIAVVFLLLGVSVAVKSSCSFEQEWRSDPALVLEKTS
jgi:hypothetical protein